DGTGSDWDEPHALVVHNNSVTVTGESAGLGSFSDYLTIQYDTQGNEIFTARYNGPMSGWDIAYDLAVDDYKNIYVTGQSWDLFTDFDFLTVKYDSTGNLLWTSVYNGSANDWDVANAIAVDKAGNPVVTGSRYDLINGFDMVTVKYDTAGNEIWTAAYTGPVDGSDAGYAMSLDDHGNTYVTGLSQISGTDYDCMTSKIDSLGNIVWTELYNGPGGDHDAAYELTVHNTLITITGPSQGLDSDLDYAVIQYDSSGSQQWAYRYDGSAGQSDAPYGIIGHDDDVIVTGGTRSTATLLDYTTIRLDGTGNEMWVSTYTGPGHALDDALVLGIDHNGNIIVTGTSLGPQNNLDIATVQYDSLGNQKWISRYEGPGNGDDIPHAMRIDKYGGIYITGESMSVDTEEDMITIKYGTDGEEIWSTLYNGPGNGSDKSLAVAADTLGNCVVTGESSGSGTKLDCVTIKYGPAGDALWTVRYNGVDNDDDRGRVVVLDRTGNVTIAGTVYNPVTFNDFLIVQYNHAGHELWTNTYDGPGGTWDTVYDMVQDKNDNIHITGPSRGSGTDFDYATIKYDAQGQELWVARYDGPVNAWDEAYSLAVDTAGNVIVTGESQGMGTNADYTTIKYDSSGNELWVERYNGPINDSDAAYDLSLDDEGNIYVTGESRGVGTLADFTTIKYDRSGEELWAVRYDGPGNNEDIARAISVDDNGDVIVAGISVYPLGISSVYTIVKYSQEDTIDTYININIGRPLTCTLHQNYPNPFNPTTIIPYSIPKPGQVR
ncbi:hypothetical protein ACFL6A_04740, partial [bacterium]